jgi:hypothetical protein
MFSPLDERKSGQIQGAQIRRKISLASKLSF